MGRNRTALITIGFLALLGAGIATMSRAQQPAPAPRAAEDRPSREKHAALRAEVDLLQLQYTAASTVLQEAMKQTEDLEFVRQVNHLHARGTEGAVRGSRLGEADHDQRAGRPGAREEARAAEEAIQRLEKAWQGVLDSKKKAFVKLATTLHEKSLELSVYERQHEETR